VPFCKICGYAAKAAEGKELKVFVADESQISCRKCGKALPAGSKFCLKCGEAVSLPSDSDADSVVKPVAACTKCKAPLPEGSEFCAQCGHAVHAVYTTDRKRKLAPAKPRFVLWALILTLAGLIGWAVSSDSSAAFWLKSVVNRSHAETVTPPSFEVSPGGYSVYKVNVPAGASHVMVSGSFSVAGQAADDIEVSLMSDTAFVSWQNGYSGDTYYSSGKVTQGGVEADLPTNAGNYFLVFNNKFSQRVAKQVQANVTLHYDRWWPIF
jgi:predicted nucleic acid-binding Zn ribbon protein